MKSKITVLIAGSVLILATALFGSWSTQVSNVSATLYDVDCTGEDLAWAVGAGGVIVHTTDGGAHWVEQTSNVTTDLYGVDFLDAQTGWIAGFGPDILHTTDGGATWLPQTPGTPNSLLDIAFANANRGWASGITGTIIGTTNGGATWNSEISGVWGWFWGATAASATNAWVIGGDWFNHVAPIYHYNGASWTHQFDITATQSGQGISAADGSMVWAVGDSGAIAHSTNGGTSWYNQTSGIQVMVNHPCAVSANQCWVTAMGGTILHTSNGGSVWEPETSGVSEDLYGIIIRDSSTGWAVGSNGRILRRSGPGAVVGEHVPEPIRPSIAISPNPVRSGLRLKMPDLERADVTVRLSDAGGRSLGVLYSGPARDELHFNTERLPAGAYFLTITSPLKCRAVRFLKAD
jgi:photosystem II stability/assembly factor-like uncharacterized protein